MKRILPLVLLASALAAPSARAAATTPPEGVTLADLTTTTSGGVSSSSTTHNSYPASKAFDGNRSNGTGRWLASKASDMYVVYRFNEPTAVNAIQIWNGNNGAGGYDSANRAPKAWTFSGSNDGSSWTPLDAQTSETGWSASGESRYYEFRNNTAYEYYKFNCTALNGSSADYLQIWEIEFYYINLGAPALGAVSIARTGAETYSVTAAMEANAADTISWIADDGTTARTNAFATVVGEGLSGTGTIANLPRNKTYRISVLAENADGSDEKAAGVVYIGELALGTPTDANEYHLVPGTVPVSRADNAPWPLVVNYTVATDAAGIAAGAAEGTTWAAPGPVEIPAGQATGSLLVTPRNDPDVTEDVSVTVTLAAGNYEIPSQDSATLAILNLVAPSGYNTWVSPSNSLASIDSNWSLNHAPTAAENVLFDGDFTSANCEWDAAATPTVASWTMQNGYAGVVTLDTVFPGKGEFQCLAVTGAMTVDSGTITHPLSLKSTSGTWLTGAQVQEQEVYRLCLHVGGTLTVGARGAIDVKDKGHYQALSRDCYGAHAVGYSSLGGAAAYGNPKEPIDVGMGCNGNQWAWVSYPGSGAIRITAGDVVVNGSICANAGSVSYGSHRRFTAAAGSIWIDADSITGSGSITAVAVRPPDGSCGSNGRGSGGSIALWTQTPVALGAPFVSAGAAESGFNAPGTVYLHDRTMDKGVLVVDGMRSGNPLDYRACVNVTTEGDWTFDEVRLQNHGTLSVPVGTTLSLPGGWAAITSTNAVSAENYGVLRYEGGTLDVGTAASAVLNGRWMLAPWSNLVVNADITVRGGAAIGVPAMAAILDNGSALPAYVSCNLTVDGDLTVESDGSLVAKQCGLKKYSNSFSEGFKGVLPGHTHGGRCLFFKDLDAQGRYYTGYDSVFAPHLPGISVPYPNGQSAEASGGVITLVVSGALTLDGDANANGMLEKYADGGNCSGGTGGAIDITAGSISGSGRILAEAGTKQAQRGSGGRIAVKLTDPGADFSAFTGTMSASGRTRNSVDKDANLADSSAGTVYLQTAADGDKGGTVRIAMSEGNRYVYNTNTTQMVSLGYGGDDVRDYKRVSYVVSDFGHAAVNTNFTAKSVTIADTDSSIDLEGHTLTVREFNYAEDDGGTTRMRHLAPGAYPFAALQGYAWAFDSSAEQTGTLVVLGQGTVIIVK